MAWNHLRGTIIGSPLPSKEAEEKRLDKVRALAALSPDALASVAYANQEIYLGLIVAGAAGLAYSSAIAVAITVLLAILTVSYSQTISAYPTGGGSYAVARENLGISMGLIAAAALIIDYILNAAVSLTAGVAAISSAFPALWPYRVILSLGLLLVITIVNLRGVREAGTFMMFPVYSFLFVYLGIVAYGVIATATGELEPGAAGGPASLTGVTLILLLRTFASGSTALTGVEAISNAVPAFKPPEVRNARMTMAAMALLMGIIFLGTIGLTRHLGIVAGPDETVLSALARQMFGSGFVYYAVQIVTLLMLIVAANTSFTGFPRVASILAQDGYVPRQLRNLGDRLVFSNGIVLLAGLAGLLILLFQGDSHRLIPLFAVGAFLAFTLSQAGMVVHWVRVKGRGWQTKAAINGLGVVATGIALGIIASTKFTHGAWIVALLIPLFVLGFRSVRLHYEEISGELTLGSTRPTFVVEACPRIVIPVAGLHRGVVEALQYARSISERVTAVHVEIEPGSAANLEAKWHERGVDSFVPLVVVPSPYRSFVGPFLEYVDRLDAEANDGQLASIVIPEFVPARWWHNILHNQTAWLLRVTLLYRRHRLGKSRAIIDIPFQLRH